MFVHGPAYIEQHQYLDRIVPFGHFLDIENTTIPGCRTNGVMQIQFQVSGFAIQYQLPRQFLANLLIIKQACPAINAIEVRSKCLIEPVVKTLILDQ